MEVTPEVFNIFKLPGKPGLRMPERGLLTAKEPSFRRRTC
jgi:hypothetical protein